MNQKEESLSANCPQKIKNGDFKSKSLILFSWKATEVACSRCSLRKLILNYFLRRVSITESDWSKVVPATLLKSLSAMGVS